MILAWLGLCNESSSSFSPVDLIARQTCSKPENSSVKASNNTSQPGVRQWLERVWVDFHYSDVMIEKVDKFVQLVSSGHPRFLPVAMKLENTMQKKVCFVGI